MKNLDPRSTYVGVRIVLAGAAFRDHVCGVAAFCCRCLLGALFDDDRTSWRR